MRYTAPEIGTCVTIGDKGEAWTVTSYEGDDTVVLTRRGVAPWTSMDSIMGNGPAPKTGTYTMRFTLTGDGEGDSSAPTFDLD